MPLPTWLEIQQQMYNNNRENRLMQNQQFNNMLQTGLQGVQAGLGGLESYLKGQQARDQFNQTLAEQKRQFNVENQRQNRIADVDAEYKKALAIQGQQANMLDWLSGGATRQTQENIANRQAGAKVDAAGINAEAKTKAAEIAAKAKITVTGMTESGKTSRQYNDQQFRGALAQLDNDQFNQELAQRRMEWDDKKDQFNALLEQRKKEQDAGNAIKVAQLDAQINKDLADVELRGVELKIMAQDAFSRGTLRQAQAQRLYDQTDIDYGNLAVKSQNADTYASSVDNQFVLGTVRNKIAEKNANTNAFSANVRAEQGQQELDQKSLSFILSQVKGLDPSAPNYQIAVEGIKEAIKIIRKANPDMPLDELSNRLEIYLDQNITQTQGR